MPLVLQIIYASSKITGLVSCGPSLLGAGLVCVFTGIGQVIIIMLYACVCY